MFAWDYRGYGRSEGKPHEENVLADARLAQLWLANRAGVRPEDVVLWGRSLGGGVAVGLAAKYPVRGLVLERTFAGARGNGRVPFPVAARAVDHAERIPLDRRGSRTIAARLLQVHGTADRVVPFEMGKQLFDAAPSANKRFIVVDGGDHNGPQPEEFYEAADEFFDSLPSASAGVASSAEAAAVRSADFLPLASGRGPG